MRVFLVLISLILSVSAQGQPRAASTRPDTVARGPQALASGPRSAVTAAGALGGIALGAAVVAASSATGDGWGNDADAVILVVAYGTGVVLATRLAGAAYGAHAPWGDSVRDALLGLPAGALAGLVVGGVAGGGFFAIQLATDTAGEYNFVPAGIAILLGVPTAVWVSARVASRSLRVSPAALAAPTGERSAGLSLRIGL